MRPPFAPHGIPPSRTAVALAAALALAAIATPAPAQDGPPEGIVVWRGTDTMVASELGAIEVVTPAGETLGDVSDTILSHDGRLVALVVGVGGFLGLAEKEVAVRWEHLSVRAKAAEGEFEIVCELDRAALEAAPPYRATKE